MLDFVSCLREILVVLKRIGEEVSSFVVIQVRVDLDLALESLEQEGHC